MLVYTPMKRESPLSLLVGAVPGALPVWMGYAAMSGNLDLAGFALFSVIFFWQLPHFLAIGVYREMEYRNAGYKVMSDGFGPEGAKSMILGSSIPMVLASLWLYQLNLGGVLYLLVTITLGIWFLALCVGGFSAENANKWARKIFLATLVYQTVLFGALAVDVGLQALV